MAQVEIVHDTVGMWTKGQRVPAGDIDRGELRRLLDLGAVRMAEGSVMESHMPVGSLSPEQRDLVEAHSELADRINTVERDAVGLRAENERLKRELEEARKGKVAAAPAEAPKPAEVKPQESPVFPMESAHDKRGKKG